MSNKPSRRAVVRSGVWAVPAVAIATTAPAFAASGSNSVVNAVANKCPGESSHGEETYWTTIVTLLFSDPVQSLVVSQGTLNDNVWNSPAVKTDCNDSKTLYVELPHSDSEHGGGTVTYLVDGQSPQTVAFYYDNHPLHGYPCTGDCG